ncbi:hypothetical protein LTS18_006179 [Coniosporium uncinatum]|uniref:Uncharacterized protein n=1 Tax=Coniosporium uncinatum TaxID=93489 RepID=A0ACC3DDL1_9PEZI|nr:hypothetical protein LTS18_006179 [Coniosporium uncinatum]
MAFRLSFDQEVAATPWLRDRPKSDERSGITSIIDLYSSGESSLSLSRDLVKQRLFDRDERLLTSMDDEASLIPKPLMIRKSPTSAAYPAAHAGHSADVLKTLEVLAQRCDNGVRRLQESMKAERESDEFSWSDPMVYLEASSELSGQHEHTELVFVKPGGIDTSVLDRVRKGEMGSETSKIDILRPLKFRLSGLLPLPMSPSRMEGLVDAVEAATGIVRHRGERYGEEVSKELKSLDALYKYTCVEKLVKRYNDMGPAVVAIPEFFGGGQEQLKTVLRQQWRWRYREARERFRDRLMALKLWEKQAKVDEDEFEIERVQREKRRLNGVVFDRVMQDQLKGYMTPLKAEEDAAVEEIECLYGSYVVQLGLSKAEDLSVIQLAEKVIKQQDHLSCSLDTIMPDAEAQIDVLDCFSQYAVDNAKRIVTRMHRMMARDVEDSTERMKEMHKRLSHEAGPQQMLKTWDELREVRENNEGLLVRVEALELQLKGIVGSGLDVITVLDEAILQTQDTPAEVESIR